MLTLLVAIGFGLMALGLFAMLLAVSRAYVDKVDELKAAQASAQRWQSNFLQACSYLRASEGYDTWSGPKES